MTPTLDTPCVCSQHPRSVLNQVKVALKRYSPLLIRQAVRDQHPQSPADTCPWLKIPPKALSFVGVYNHECSHPLPFVGTAVLPPPPTAPPLSLLNRPPYAAIILLRTPFCTILTFTTPRVHHRLCLHLQREVRLTRGRAWHSHHRRGSLRRLPRLKIRLAGALGSTRSSALSRTSRPTAFGLAPYLLRMQYCPPLQAVHVWVFTCGCGRGGWGGGGQRQTEGGDTSCVVQTTVLCFKNNRIDLKKKYLCNV